MNLFDYCLHMTHGVDVLDFRAIAHIGHGWVVRNVHCQQIFLWHAYFILYLEIRRIVTHVKKVQTLLVCLLSIKSLICNYLLISIVGGLNLLFLRYTIDIMAWLSHTHMIL